MGFWEKLFGRIRSKNTYTIFSCPHCKGVIRFSPPIEWRKRLAENAVEGKPILFGITCHHCPQAMFLNPKTGEAIEFNDELVARTGAGAVVIEESILRRGPGIYAANEEIVEKLNYEASQLMAIDISRAEKKFREALHYRRNDAITWYNIGVCRIEIGDWEEAVNCFSTALSFDRSILDCWNNLGSCLIKLERMDDADKCFDEALEVNADYPKFYLGKANVAIGRGDYQTGRRYLNKALEKDPSYKPAHEVLRRLPDLEARFGPIWGKLDALKKKVTNHEQQKPHRQTVTSSDQRHEAIKELSRAFKHYSEAGIPKEEIKEHMQGLKKAYHFNNDEIFDFFITECLAHKRFFSIKDFMDHCARFPLPEIREKYPMIFDWMLDIANSDDDIEG